MAPRALLAALPCLLAGLSLVSADHFGSPHDPALLSVRSSGPADLEEAVVGAPPPPPTPAKLLGLFSSDCQPISWFDPGATNVSMASTLRYLNNGSYEVDVTEYVGETGADKCSPLLTDTYAKYQIRGIFSGKGPNKVDKTLVNGQWDHNWSRWLFPSTPAGRQVGAVLALMNQQCPCGGTWQQGVWRTVDSDTDCSAAEKAKTDLFYLCQVVVGNIGYGTYKWLDANSYVSSAIAFDKNDGWNNKPTSFVRHKLEETGVHDPADCDYIRWSACGLSLTDAGTNCDTCDGLECDGCLYRELVDISIDKNAWVDCCPCLWYYGQRYHYNWMLTAC